MSTGSARRVAVGSAVAGVVLLVVVALNSFAWLGVTFPGFLIMANRVVPSISLPEWAAGDPSRVFQHQVLAVDGVPVHSAPEAYARVAAHAAGSDVSYRVRAPGGDTLDVVVPTRRFTAFDHVALLGAFLLNGLAFLATGLLVFWLQPRNPASLGLLAATLCTSVFVLTAVDLYGPAWFFRLHVAAEALMGAAFLHLALVFPTDRARGRWRAKLAIVYAPFVALTAVYETLLYSPSGYTVVHLAATAGQVLGATALLSTVAWNLFSTRSPLLRRRAAVVALGTFAGFLLPAILWGVSAAVGGSVPLNAAAFTAFLFPLSIGYAITKQDLFEIDVLLRRAATYVIVVLAVGTIYLVVLVGIGSAVPFLGVTSESRAMLATLNLAVLFLLAPVHARVQSVLDRLFFRTGYDAELVLAGLSRRLAVARDVEEVAQTTLGTLREALWPRRASLLLAGPGGRFTPSGGETPDEQAVALPHVLQSRFEHGDLLTRYEWDDGSGRPVPEVWSELAADLLVPVRHDEGQLALLVLGPRESGRPYTMFDATLLRTVANQVGLALTSAAAFERLAVLNASLEEQVGERTAELEDTNRTLAASIEDVREAYHRLERSQTSLIRADRLATLGRLAAGVAHEVNTPLAAVMNSLKLIEDLGQEYAESIDDPAVKPGDHHQIAAEIVTAAHSAHGWAKRGASFIAKMKLHGRGGSDAGVASAAEVFPLRAVTRDAETLLAHRMRALSASVEYEEEPVDVCVVGDAGRLSQILVNLLQNAIDAYEERGYAEARLAVAARATSDGVLLTVRDWAGGITEDVLPRIFEELFTTKEPGRGTGLGLWIARNLVEHSFGGTLTVESEPGVGTCFTALLRGQAAQARPTAEAVSLPQ